MVFSVRGEMFNNENDICFRIVKVNRKSIILEIYHFNHENGITDLSYKNVKKSYGNTIQEFTGDYEFISFNYNGNRYRFSCQECRNNLY